MNRESAIKAIEASLARGSNTPCTRRDDRDKYIAEEAEKLFSSVIDPVQVQAIGEYYNYGTLDRLAKQTVYAVARSEKGWLLYSPETGDFSLAFGSSASELELLGFASDDALAEWLG